jgi:hypothetical protein
MKIIQIAGGIILIGFSLLLTFGIVVSTLKEGDEENVFLYLSIPIVILALGIYLVIKGSNQKFNVD